MGKTSKFKTKNSGSASGQFLVEAMVALGLITVGLLGMLELLSSSLSLNRVTADQYTGAYIASEGIEIIKNLIDVNVIAGAPWNTGFMNGSFEADYTYLSLPLTAYGSGRFINLDATTGAYSYAAGTPTSYKRRIDVALIGGNEIQVNSLVTWSSRGGASFSVNLEDHFYNWR